MDLSPSALQEWLGSHADECLPLRKPDFLEFFEPWRVVFEPLFRDHRPTATDVTAMGELEAHLPADCVVFCLPGYAHAPAATAHPFYAFRVAGLRKVSRGLFNDHDATVADVSLDFCCMYTHEVGSLADPEFWARQSPGRPRRGPRPSRQRN